jgi:hypothetical protein
MCKAKVKMDIYYANICKHEHEKNMRRLWCKIVLKTNVEQTKKNEGSYEFHEERPLVCLGIIDGSLSHFSQHLLND